MHLLFDATAIGTKCWSDSIAERASLSLLISVLGNL